MPVSSRERWSDPAPGDTQSSPPGPDVSRPTTARPTSWPTRMSAVTARTAAYAERSTAVGRPGPAATRQTSRASRTTTTDVETHRS
ncbi:hypothetical protein ACFQL4_17535 [Halosimplex aquaticum]